jgi:hypothetical protein
MSNEWQAAFDASFNTVLSEFSIPSGKNRYHKFRDKIVEIWKAMQENQAKTGKVSDSNPLYAMAARQYRTFLRVTEERKTAVSLDDRKPAPLSSPVSHKNCNLKPRPTAVPATASTATNAAATPVTGTKKRPATGAPATTSTSAAAITQLAPVGLGTAARAIADSGNNTDQSGLLEVLMSKLETITVLLQTANNNPQMPPKLPILLNDLHRIRVRTTDPDELAVVKPYYLDLLNNYLQAIEYKIRSDSVGPHPATLMIDLEGMDLLRQGLRNDPEMLVMVQTTYQKTLMKYLKMVNPRIPVMAKHKRARES